MMYLTISQIHSCLVGKKSVCAYFWTSTHIFRPIIGAFTDTDFVWLKSQYLSDENRYLHILKRNMAQRCIPNTCIMCRVNLYNNQASDENDLSPYPKICNFRPSVFCYTRSQNGPYCSCNAHFCFVWHLMLWGTENMHCGVDKMPCSVSLWYM